MPFAKLKESNDFISRVLAIVAIAITIVIFIQSISQYQTDKKRQSNMDNILEYMKKQNATSIEDRKILHEHNEKSKLEREELFDKINKLEGRKNGP